MKKLLVMLCVPVAMLCGCNKGVKRDWANSKIQIEVLLADDNWYPVEVVPLDSAYSSEASHPSKRPIFKIDVMVEDNFKIKPIFTASCFNHNEENVVAEAEFDSPPFSGEWSKTFDCGANPFRGRTVVAKEAKPTTDIATICENVDTDPKKVKLKQFCQQYLSK